MNRFLLTFCVLLGSLMAHADKFSYLYIQGDQKTPFYVKLEDAMQPRFGKNYCIVPRLAPGPAHIEILFQQNQFPAQAFNIQIPEDGARSFLLVNRKDSAFLLYDLQQGFYLKAGNNISEDREPIKAAPAPQALAVPTAEPEKSNVPKQPAAANAGAPVFIQNLELNSHSPDSSAVEKIPAGKKATADSKNDGCGQAVTSTEFEPIFKAFSAGDDEEKLEHIYGELENCYATWQIRSLAERLSSDAARFELLKKLYPHTADPSSYPLLDDLLSSETWKAEFKKLIHP